MGYSGEPSTFPRFVVFEGVDGVGKSTLAQRLLDYYNRQFPNLVSKGASFPGSSPGSLGEWVYRLHHGETKELDRESIAPEALQLLHVAAHVDSIQRWIEPSLRNGNLILDRYWWSTYAYSRDNLDSDDAWTLVSAEMPFWRSLPEPTIIYVHRSASLKRHEIDQMRHERLHNYYLEIISRQKHSGVAVIDLPNEGNIETCWTELLGALNLPEVEMGEPKGA